MLAGYFQLVILATVSQGQLKLVDGRTCQVYID